MAETVTGHACTPGEAAEAQAYGLTSNDLRDWAPFSPVEIYWALSHGVTRAIAGAYQSFTSSTSTSIASMS